MYSFTKYRGKTSARKSKDKNFVNDFESSVLLASNPASTTKTCPSYEHFVIKQSKRKTIIVSFKEDVVPG